jgi:hypothetical protein
MQVSLLNKWVEVNYFSMRFNKQSQFGVKLLLYIHTTNKYEVLYPRENLCSELKSTIEELCWISLLKSSVYASALGRLVFCFLLSGSTDSKGGSDRSISSKFLFWESGISTVRTGSDTGGKTGPFWGDVVAAADPGSGALNHGVGDGLKGGVTGGVRIGGTGGKLDKLVLGRGMFGTECSGENCCMFGMKGGEVSGGAG